VKNKLEFYCKFCSIEEDEKIKKSNYIPIILSTILLPFGFYFKFVYPTISFLIFFSVFLIAGYKIILSSLKYLLNKKITIELLMTIASIGAFLIGHFEEGAIIVFLFYVAELLEEYASQRAVKSVSSLLKFLPQSVNVKGRGKVHIHDVNVGEIIIVKPGDKIPLDGKIVNGISTIDESTITGESIPITKSVGDEVYAGTLNNEGYLEIKVTKRHEETLISKVLKIIEEAKKKKSKTEDFIERFAKFYTPTIVTIAILVMLIPPLIFNEELIKWIYVGLILLVVSCPCALVISTPISMVSAITAASRDGVLIKGGKYLEEISKCKTWIFDKTGTITEGDLKIENVYSLDKKINKNEILKIAASLEYKSNHPIAKAILNYAKEKNIKLEKVDKFKYIAGKGILGSIKGKKYYIGNKKLFEDLKIRIPKLNDNEKNFVFVGRKNKIIGYISFTDKIKKEAFETLNFLKRNGIKIIMITGDNKQISKKIARKLGIKEFFAEMLPTDKVKVIDNYKSVCMVGDGINDAPAIAKANVGIVMGMRGSEKSIEVSDIILTDDNLSKLKYLLNLSKKTLRIIKQNIVSSITIKIFIAILALFGLINLWMAVAIGDLGLSLAVILNAFRLRKL